MNSLKNKVALITGSARGLGKAIAERYAAMGANIVINYSRDKASAEEVESNIKAMGVKVISLQADVSKVADIERLFTEAKKCFWKNRHRGCQCRYRNGRNTCYRVYRRAV